MRNSASYPSQAGWVAWFFVIQAGSDSPGCTAHAARSIEHHLQHQLVCIHRSAWVGRAILLAVMAHAKAHAHKVQVSLSLLTTAVLPLIWALGNPAKLL